MFTDYDDFTVSPFATVYEHGWQSWSPATVYPAAATSWRPVRQPAQIMNYRPETPAPRTGFQGEGLLVVDPADGSPVRLYAAADGMETVPSIRASLTAGRMRIRADGPIETCYGRTVRGALADWADRFAARAGVVDIRPAPTMWCSWYHYFTQVTAADITENLAAIGRHDLPVDVVQIDDGWQSEIGDWLTYSDRFPSFPELIRQIRDAGRRAGIWLAPFLVTSRSQTFEEHPDWLLRQPDGTLVDAGHNWNTQLYALDTTHPGARAYLTDSFERLRELDIDFYKVDFVYAGALEGVRHDGSSPLAAYRSGISLIRAAIGPQAYLLGCGAPILPSVGLVDAMRVSPDTALHYLPTNGDDVAMPSQQGATLSTVGRAFQHGRFWVNDSDCLIARPDMQRRHEWASIVEQYSGLRTSSDRIASLDAWGLETTRRILSTAMPPTPFVGVPDIFPTAPNGGW
ncbi:glycoside hydrolase family 36 protein [Catellatospora tritici]|uniref:glycoside hydrolase family 36 protein n=1 Tax=Catellatospora tritici TaxID=2851566 RepID=UPI001C2D82A7|nr:glycoside hydrolase family 36 protein [Catellatospora tritici]MBV1855190.1 alpha-galactosidase [Catellatospora tritici]